MQDGVEVTALTRREGPEPWYVAMGDAPWSADRLARIIEATQPDAIFHLAGGVAGAPHQVDELNLGMTWALMRALGVSGFCPLLVCCGSAAEYGSAIADGVPVSEDTPCLPVSPYGIAKLAQTQAALAFSEATGTPVLVARIFNPVGPGMPQHLAIGEFARQIAVMPALGGVLQTGNLNTWRDFIDADYVVDALVRLAERPEARGVVNICSGQATPLRDLLRLLIDASGKQVSVEPRRDRMRSDDFAVVIGSTERLAQLGAALPATDFTELMARVWIDARQRWAQL
jgi:GDP-4-dehydro-6-deoxy-D-mannose reductase